MPEGLLGWLAIIRWKAASSSELEQRDQVLADPRAQTGPRCRLGSSGFAKPSPAQSIEGLKHLDEVLSEIFRHAPAPRHPAELVIEERRETRAPRRRCGPGCPRRGDSGTLTPRRPSGTDSSQDGQICKNDFLVAMMKNENLARREFASLAWGRPNALRRHGAVFMAPAPWAPGSSSLHRVPPHRGYKPCAQPP